MASVNKVRNCQPRMHLMELMPFEYLLKQRLNLKIKTVDL